MLGGLHLVYGLPMTLVVMDRNGGYAIACNRAAALARGRCWRWSIPTSFRSTRLAAERWRSGSTTAASARSAPSCSLRTARSSMPACSSRATIADAGSTIITHKGMPRHYAPAERERSVPGITGACMVMRRALFEEVGGFTEDYVIGDYEDSDLCLKIRHARTRHPLRPAAELYHLERQSMRESADYMRGVASQYNSWLQTERWEDAIGDLMASFAAQPQTLRVA